MENYIGELKACWGKKEKDVILKWNGVGTTKSNGSWLCSWLSYHRGFENTFLKELESRGYDLTTLKISIKKKHL